MAASPNFLACLCLISQLTFRAFRKSEKNSPKLSENPLSGAFLFRKLRMRRKGAGAVEKKPRELNRENREKMYACVVGCIAVVCILFACLAAVLRLDQRGLSFPLLPLLIAGAVVVGVLYRRHLFRQQARQEAGEAEEKKHAPGLLERKAALTLAILLVFGAGAALGAYGCDAFRRWETPTERLQLAVEETARRTAFLGEAEHLTISLGDTPQEARWGATQMYDLLSPARLCLSTLGDAPVFRQAVGLDELDGEQAAAVEDFLEEYLELLRRIKSDPEAMTGEEKELFYTARALFPRYDNHGPYPFETLYLRLQNSPWAPAA